MDRTLQAMTVFTRIARLGSFTAAADALGIGVASASVLVRQLEDHLGVTLLQRSTRSVRLTAEGSQYLEHCHRVLDDIETMKAHLSGAVEIARGRLTVDLDQEVAHGVLPFVPEFRSAYPDVGLRLAVGGDVDGLIANGVDCAVVTGALPDSSFRSRRVGTYHAVTVASPAYLSLHGAPKSIEQLHQHDVIHYTPRRFGPPREFRYVVSGNETRIKLAERISVSDAHAAIRYAIDGVGIAQVCRRMVEEHLEAGRLVSLLDGSEPPALPISVLYSGRGQPSKSIRVFIDWLHDQMNHPRAGSRQIDMPPITGFSASTSSMRQRDSYHPTAVLQNRPPPGELRLASARPAG